LARLIPIGHVELTRGARLVDLHFVLQGVDLFDIFRIGGLISVGTTANT
jgi:hypothetical protein